MITLVILPIQHFIFFNCHECRVSVWWIIAELKAVISRYHGSVFKFESMATFIHSELPQYLPLFKIGFDYFCLLCRGLRMYEQVQTLNIINSPIPMILSLKLTLNDMCCFCFFLVYFRSHRSSLTSLKNYFFYSSGEDFHILVSIFFTNLVYFILIGLWKHISRL